MNDEFDADFEAKLAAILDDGVTDDGKISVDLGRSCHDLTADEMIAAILASDEGDDGTLANDLLSELKRGHPVLSLLPLLQSTIDDVRSTAAFLVAELGAQARTLRHEIVSLLGHESARIRSDAISALSACATWADGPYLGQLLTHLADPHRGPRYHAMMFVRLSERCLLMAALDHVGAGHSAAFKQLRSAHLQVECGGLPVLREMLSCSDPIVRRFAIGLSLRPRLVVDQCWVEAGADAFRDELGDMADTLSFQQRVLPSYAISSSDMRPTGG